MPRTQEEGQFKMVTMTYPGHRSSLVTTGCSGHYRHIYNIPHNAALVKLKGGADTDSNRHLTNFIPSAEGTASSYNYP